MAVVTYLARAITILVPLAAILTIAAVPLLFLDLWAAGALFLVALALVGVIALLVALCFVLFTRTPGQGPRRRFLIDLTGALGRLAGGLR